MREAEARARKAEAEAARAEADATIGGGIPLGYSAGYGGGGCVIGRRPPCGGYGPVLRPAGPGTPVAARRPRHAPGTTGVQPTPAAAASDASPPRRRSRGAARTSPQR